MEVSVYQSRWLFVIMLILAMGLFSLGATS